MSGLCFLASVFLMLGLMGVVVAVIVSATGDDSPMNWLSDQFHGRVREEETPHMEFSYQGTTVHVSTVSVGAHFRRHYTQVRFPWPTPPLRGEVYPETPQTQLRKLLGLEDIQIGDAAFDQRYYITSSDPAAMRRFLAPHVQDTIESMRRMLNNDDIYLSIGGGMLAIRKLGLVHQRRQLDRFVRLALQLLDRVATGDEGIEFVVEESRAAAEPLEVQCQICGEPVDRVKVICLSCETPHHRECWEYYGACSTYGCGEIRYRVEEGQGGRP